MQILYTHKMVSGMNMLISRLMLGLTGKGIRLVMFSLRAPTHQLCAAFLPLM